MGPLTLIIDLARGPTYLKVDYKRKIFTCQSHPRTFEIGYVKGQLISKCLFGVFTFFQKTNENKSTSSKVEFVRSFFGRNFGLKKSIRICLTFSMST